MAREPDWVAIEKCPIWKILGVIECNNCEGLIECWGEGTQLQINDEAINALLISISKESNG